jgi:hypothetical protein
MCGSENGIQEKECGFYFIGNGILGEKYKEGEHSMARFVRIAVFLFVFFLAAGGPLNMVKAAPEQIISNPAKLTVDIQIPDKTFWNFIYLNKDGASGKPAVVKVGWSLGEIAQNTNYQVAVESGKSSGQITITTAKGAMVNLRVSVRDTGNDELGFLNLQVKNKGQKETFSIAPPDYCEPKISYGLDQQDQ